MAKPLFGQPAGTNALSSILTADETNLFAKEYEVVVNRSQQAQAQLCNIDVARRAHRRSQIPPQYLDPVTNKLTEQYPRHLVADGRANHRWSFRAWREPPDLLRAARQLRHPRQSGSLHAKLLTQLGQALEYFDGLMTTSGLERPGHHVHCFRLRQNPHIQQRWHRPRMGKSSLRGGRCRARTETCMANTLSSAPTRRTTWALAALSLLFPWRIRRNPGPVVWPLRRPDQTRSPQPRQLRLKPIPRLHGLEVSSQSSAFDRIELVCAAKLKDDARCRLRFCASMSELIPALTRAA